MSWTFLACFLIAFAWMALFYLWGRGFLTIIKAETYLASCIPFGYLLLQVIYQVIYLPFYFFRGSYRAVSYIWIGVVAISSIFLFIFLRKHTNKHSEKLNALKKAGVCTAAALVLALAIYISLHVPYYGQDTRTYINTMNESYFRDSMWVSEGRLDFHYGMSSMFQFFTVPSLLTGIKPYYISLFTVRIVGICLMSLIVYRTGVVAFRKEKGAFCWPAIFLAVLAPYLLMFWGSNYTAEFFYWRINEAKGYCQFVLLPLGFSVALAMFKEGVDRKPIWKQQFLVGLAAVSISASSLTPYLFLLFMGTMALLFYDKFKAGWRAIGNATLCAIPNLIYLFVYILETKGIIVL